MDEEGGKPNVNYLLIQEKESDKHAIANRRKQYLLITLAVIICVIVGLGFGLLMRRGRSGNGNDANDNGAPIVPGQTGVDFAGVFDDYECLRQQVDFVVIRAFHSYGAFDTSSIDNIKNAQKSGFSMDATSVYMFPCASKSRSAKQQMQWMINNLTANGVQYNMIWIDVEENPKANCSWTQFSDADNCKFILDLASSATEMGKNVGIYSSHYQWVHNVFSTASACSAASIYPLWYAYWDHNKTFSDWEEYPFGGWESPAMKQYTNEFKLCNHTFDEKKPREKLSSFGTHLIHITSHHMPHKTKTTAKEGTTKKKLRTSLDVYHRLLHDTTLGMDTQKIQIGYTDGKYPDIQHLPLCEWVMIDKGGDIPMHHIVYFKYENIILWDKRVRLDRLYGSGATKPAQLLSNLLVNDNTQENATENDTNEDAHEHKTPAEQLDYPSIGKIVADPRTEQVIENKLLQKGIQKISYVYSFGMIGYKVETVNGEKRPRYIVIQHRKNKQWGFAKGRYEAGEGKYGYFTACREFEEESGIAVNTNNVLEVDWLNPYISHYQYKWKNTLIKKWTVLFAAKLATHVQPKVTRPNEIADVRYMTLAKFLQLNKHNENEQIVRDLNQKLVSSIEHTQSEPGQARNTTSNDIGSNARHAALPSLDTLLCPQKTVCVKEIICDVEALIKLIS